MIKPGGLGSNKSVFVSKMAIFGFILVLFSDFVLVCCLRMVCTWTVCKNTRNDTKQALATIWNLCYKWQSATPLNECAEPLAQIRVSHNLSKWDISLASSWSIDHLPKVCPEISSARKREDPDALPGDWFWYKVRWCNFLIIYETDWMRMTSSDPPVVPQSWIPNNFDSARGPRHL